MYVAWGAWSSATRLALAARDAGRSSRLWRVRATWNAWVGARKAKRRSVRQRGVTLRYLRETRTRARVFRALAQAAHLAALERNAAAHHARNAVAAALGRWRCATAHSALCIAVVRGRCARTLRAWASVATKARQQRAERLRDEAERAAAVVRETRHRRLSARRLRRILESTFQSWRLAAGSSATDRTRMAYASMFHSFGGVRRALHAWRNRARQRASLALATRKADAFRARRAWDAARNAVILCRSGRAVSCLRRRALCAQAFREWQDAANVRTAAHEQLRMQMATAARSTLARRALRSWMEALRVRRCAAARRSAVSRRVEAFSWVRARQRVRRMWCEWKRLARMAMKNRRAADIHCGRTENDPWRLRPWRLAAARASPIRLACASDGWRQGPGMAAQATPKTIVLLYRMHAVLRAWRRAWRRVAVARAFRARASLCATFDKWRHWCRERQQVAFIVHVRLRRLRTAYQGWFSALCDGDGGDPDAWTTPLLQAPPSARVRF